MFSNSYLPCNTNQKTPPNHFYSKLPHKLQQALIKEAALPVGILRDRLCHVCGQASPGLDSPRCLKMFLKVLKFVWL